MQFFRRLRHHARKSSQFPDRRSYQRACGHSRIIKRPLLVFLKETAGSQILSLDLKFDFKLMISNIMRFSWYLVFASLHNHRSSVCLVGGFQVLPSHWAIFVRVHFQSNQRQCVGGIQTRPENDELSAVEQNLKWLD